MVTLTGVGGVGKTRLALRVAAQLSRTYPDGVWLVELAEVHEDELVVHTVAQALGIQDWSSRGVEAVLADYVRDKDILIVLDNCEQVLEGCVKACTVLLDVAPALRVLATSRQPLDVYGEHVLVVSTLPVPEPSEVDRLAGAEMPNSVRLFIERASAAGFRGARGQEVAIAKLCRELDGIPLAIELAAARTRFFSVDELLSRIGDRFRLLAGGCRTSARHQTLQATMDWSYELCSDEERMLWARMSVFAGGMDLTAVEQVCSSADLTPERVLDLTASLVDKSILLRTEIPAGNGTATRTRYQMLATVRDYGLSLQPESEKQQLRQRHRDWCLGLAEECAREWFGPDQLEWRARISAEHDNLRAALEFCAAQPGQAQAGLRLAGALWFYWTACGFIAEGRKWLDRLLALDSRPTEARATDLWVCSWLASHQGDLAWGRATAERCSALAEELRDPGLTAFGMHLRGVAAMAEGDLAKARELCLQAWSRHREHDEITSPMVMSLFQAGLVACLQGEPDQATADVGEVLRITAEAGESWTRSWALVVRGLASWMRGDPNAAIADLRESIGFKSRLNDLFGLGVAVEVLAWSYVSGGEHAQAARLFGVLERIWPLVGIPLLGSQQLLDYRRKAESEARAALGEKAFEGIFAETAKLPLEQGLAMTMRGKVRSTPATSPERRAQRPGWPLTRRELQVAEAVAKGMSNKEIAAQLVISQRTAEAHVEHILTKLDFGSRTQIATWVAAQRNSAEMT